VQNFCYDNNGQQQARLSVQIEARPATLGGGWRLRFFEDGEEVGGGVIPAADDEESKIVAFADARCEGDTWLASRPRPSA
jgi:hypothetical protein